MAATVDTTIPTLEVLKTLADDRRLELLRILGGRELCVCEIAEAAGMSDALVSHHLKRLRAAGLVSTRRVGQWLYCRVESSALAALAAQIESLADAGRAGDGGCCVDGCCGPRDGDGKESADHE